MAQLKCRADGPFVALEQNDKGGKKGKSKYADDETDEVSISQVIVVIHILYPQSVTLLLTHSCSHIGCPLFCEECSTNYWIFW